MQVKNHMHVIAGYKNGRAYLKHNYYRQPFKLANITENKTEGLLRLMMASSSPGILDNDHYNIEIEIEQDASVHLTTQGYQRLFSMTHKASQCMNVHVHNNGSFYFLPHPNVPHKGSSFSSLNNIYLEENHNLLWSEIITCGRKLSGEEFEFTKFHNITNVFLNNKLIVKENVLLEPLKNNVHAIGQLEGYTHQSTLLFIDTYADLEKIASACRKLLSGADGITYGISRLHVNGLIVRMLGQKGEVLFNINNELACLIQKFIKENIDSYKNLSSTVLHTTRENL